MSHVHVDVLFWVSSRWEMKTFTVKNMIIIDIHIYTRKYMAHTVSLKWYLSVFKSSLETRSYEGYYY